MPELVTSSSDWILLLLTSKSVIGCKKRTNDTKTVHGLTGKHIVFRKQRICGRTVVLLLKFCLPCWWCLPQVVSWQSLWPLRNRQWAAKLEYKLQCNVWALLRWSSLSCPGPCGCRLIDWLTGFKLDYWKYSRNRCLMQDLRRITQTVCFRNPTFMNSPIIRSKQADIRWANNLRGVDIRSSAVNFYEILTQYNIFNVQEG